MKTITDVLKTIVNLLTELNSKSQNAYLDSKSLWTLEELCAYTGFKEGYIYKLTSGNTIPHFKPTGKTIFFERDKILIWLKRNEVEGDEAIDQKIADLFTVKIDRP